MRVSRHIALALLVLSISVSSAQAAAIRYTFEFDAATLFGFSLAADSFSFETPNLLTLENLTTAVNPPQDLNGFSIDSVSVCGGGGDHLAYCHGSDFSVPVGSVGDFFFLALGAGAGPGVYSTTQAGRAIRTELNLMQYGYTTGRLTIAELPTQAVPEPATFSLLALGLAGIAGHRWRQRTRTSS